MGVRGFGYLLTALALLAAMTLVACGGKSSDDSAGSGLNDDQSAGTFLGEVPVYPEAIEEINSGAELSGADISDTAMAPPVGPSEVDVKAYTKVDLAVYDTVDSPQQVFDWYMTGMTGWTAAWSSRDDGSAQQGAMAVWTKDNGKEAAWMVAEVDFGKTSLYLWFGS